MEEIDLYETLNIQKGATKVEIKKAYHKAALSSHPDKVPPEQREEAEVKFKAVSQAYDILYDDEKRDLYDQHGMKAFDKSQGPGGPGGMGFEDIFAEMFNGGMGGGFHHFGGGGFPGGPGGQKRRGESEVQEYEVTLEELYKGKTTRFATTKNVVCSTCDGSGGKEKAKATTCAACAGRGRVTGLQQVGPGMVTQVVRECASCQGNGKVFKEKDRCKRCKGKRVVESKKMLELYIPRGSREGDKIVLEGEADQAPGQEPGDIVFVLKEKDHDVFRRAGSDLAAELKITVAEALTGFNRVVLTHLDGRAIQMHISQPKGKILRPDQILKIPNEGMPMKRSDARGDLFLHVEIEFPVDGWIKDQKTIDRIRDILPEPGADMLHVPKHDQDVEEIEQSKIEFDADLEEFGAGSGDPRSGAEWEDDEEEAGGPQCAQQ